MFIRTERHDEFVNGDDIVRLRAGTPRSAVPGSPLVDVTIASLRDGSSVVLSLGTTTEEAVTRLAPMIPATPGYEALWTVHYEDGTIDVIRHPVLGWRLGLYGELVPVTLQDEISSNVAFGGVKYPDGRVGDCDWYDTEEEWIAEIRKNARKIA